MSDEKKIPNKALVLAIENFLIFYFSVNYKFFLGYNGQGKLNHALFINPRYIK